jgi:hypothetical protein
VIWRDLNIFLKRHLATAEHAAVIVAPFIKHGALKSLLDGLAVSVAVTVYTRWHVEEVASGVSDPDILEILQARASSELRLCDELHAKLYLVDGVHALIGSANVTATALGVSARPNLELLQVIKAPAATAGLFLADLRARSRAATREEMQAVLKQAAFLRDKLPPESLAPPDAQPDTPVDSGSGLAGWFPVFRSPERLYGLATDARWLAEANPLDPALRDLLALGIHSDEGEAAFDTEIREKLRKSKLVQTLDHFLSEPRRFGSLADWLRGVMPDATREARETAGQTLIRWLTYFDPDCYAVSTPGAYSEVLSLRR